MVNQLLFVRENIQHVKRTPIVTMVNRVEAQETGVEMSFVAAYDPNSYTSIIAIINDNQEISVMWCDGSTACFWGFLQKFEPNEMSEGDNPPVGILLCTKKNNTLVEYALAGMDNSLFVSKYLLELPKKEEMQRFLKEQMR